MCFDHTIACHQRDVCILIGPCTGRVSGHLATSRSLQPYLGPQDQTPTNPLCHNLRLVSPSACSDALPHSFQFENLADERHLENGCLMLSGSILWGQFSTAGMIPRTCDRGTRSINPKREMVHNTGLELCVSVQSCSLVKTKAMQPGNPTWNHRKPQAFANSTWVEGNDRPWCNLFWVPRTFITSAASVVPNYPVFSCRHIPTKQGVASHRGQCGTCMILSDGMILHPGQLAQTRTI